MTIPRDMGHKRPDWRYHQNQEGKASKTRHRLHARCNQVGKTDKPCHQKNICPQDRCYSECDLQRLHGLQDNHHTCIDRLYLHIGRPDRLGRRHHDPRMRRRDRLDKPCARCWLPDHRDRECSWPSPQWWRSSSPSKVDRLLHELNTVPHGMAHSWSGPSWVHSPEGTLYIHENQSSTTHCLVYKASSPPPPKENTGQQDTIGRPFGPCWLLILQGTHRIHTLPQPKKHGWGHSLDTCYCPPSRCPQDRTRMMFGCCWLPVHMGMAHRTTSQHWRCRYWEDTLGMCHCPKRIDQLGTTHIACGRHWVPSPVHKEYIGTHPLARRLD